MNADWRQWAPAALTVAGLAIGMAASIQEIRLQRLAYGDAAALVNGHPIARDDVERALASAGADRRAQLTRQDRDKVLERLIEDELLAQRAVALGLPITDQNARKVLIRGLIDSVVAAAPEPSEAELRAYFSAHPALFRTADMISVAPVERAVPGLPSTPMTITKLKDYLGAEAETLAALQTGATGGPFRFAGQTFTVRITARQGGGDATYDAVRETVRARFIVERDGRRLRSYLDSLKRAAKIERIE
jgi:hypothetical protein